MGLRKRPQGQHERRISARATTSESPLECKSKQACKLLWVLVKHGQQPPVVAMGAM